MVGGDVVEQGEAVGGGHHDVGEDEVIVGVLRKAGEGFFGACGSGGGVSAMFEHRGGDGAYGFFVVDDEDSFLWHCGPAGIYRLILRGRLFVVEIFEDGAGLGVVWGDAQGEFGFGAGFVVVVCCA